MLFQNFTVLHVSSDISVLVSLIMPFFYAQQSAFAGGCDFAAFKVLKMDESSDDELPVSVAFTDSKEKALTKIKEVKNALKR